MPENENLVVTSIQEIDKAGGWLITHWTQTFDTRVPLAKIDEQIAAAQKGVADAQEALDELVTTKATISKL